MFRVLISILCVFLVWSVIDVILHGILLMPTYQATVELWRPEAEMKTGLMHLTTLILATAFTLNYVFVVSEKSLKMGTIYGAILGVMLGTSMGLGSYCYMPIPFFLAAAWLGGTVVSLVLGGVILGVLLKAKA